MAKPARLGISSRKLPQQARSERLVAGILEPAVHVLARDGAHRFTTARVAERAGVSVGSLYQYFPNKEAILYRLQTEEWRRTTAQIDSILDDRSETPFDRLRAVAHAFFQSEYDEAALRVALGDAAPLYRDAPEMREQRKAGIRRVVSFMREALPRASRRERALAANLIMITLVAAAHAVSEQVRSRADVNAFASATGEMLCAYLDRLNAKVAG